MRKFKSTPQKKLAGMLILFVFIPLFLLWYVIFFLDNRPDIFTIAILASIAVLAFYFYRKYKKQIDAIAGPKPKEPAEEMPEESEDIEEELPVEAEEELPEEIPAKKQK